MKIFSQAEDETTTNLSESTTVVSEPQTSSSESTSTTDQSTSTQTTSTSTESTTTSTTLTTTLPYSTHIINDLTVPIVPTKPPRTTLSTTTTTTHERLALKNFRASMTTEIPEACFSFKYSRISPDCCKTPNFEFTDEAVTKCKSECEKSESHHCCMTDCKYREMEIYSSEKGFDKNGIIKGFKGEKEWEEIVINSVEFCVKDQESKDTTPTPPTTTTDRVQYLIDQAISRGQGQTVPGFQPPTSAPSTTVFEESTEALKDRQEKIKHCGIPLYVYLISTCARIQNFVNCPNFNSTSDKCEESLKLIKKCGSNLKLQYV